MEIERACPWEPAVLSAPKRSRRRKPTRHLQNSGDSYRANPNGPRVRDVRRDCAAHESSSMVSRGPCVQGSCRRRAAQSDGALRARDLRRPGRASPSRNQGRGQRRSLRVGRPVRTFDLCDRLAHLPGLLVTQKVALVEHPILAVHFRQYAMNSIPKRDFHHLQRCVEAFRNLRIERVQIDRFAAVSSRPSQVSRETLPGERIFQLEEPGRRRGVVKFILLDLALLPYTPDPPLLTHAPGVIFLSSPVNAPER